MDEAFDPYYVWLGIPPHEQPPNYYRLLGVALFEPRSDVIQVAAQKQIAHVKTFALGDFAEPARRLLTELTQAKLCLLNPSKRATYDVRLQSQLDAAATAGPRAAAAVAPPTRSPATASAEDLAEAPVLRVLQDPVVPPATAPGEPLAEAPAGASPPWPVHGGQAAPHGTSGQERESHAVTSAEPARQRTRVWIVGADRDCDVVVPDPPVSARHLRLFQTDDGIYIEDLASTNGTYVDGKRIEGRTRVSVSSRVTLGRRVPLPWPPELLQAEEKPTNRIVTIGAAPDNDIVIDLPVISGHHARLVVENNAVYIEDLNSTNGTALGSPANRIRRARLEPKDIVYLGSYPVPATRLLARLGGRSE